jgi:hypothetical protein
MWLDARSCMRGRARAERALKNIFPVARQRNVKFVIATALNVGFISGTRATTTARRPGTSPTSTAMADPSAHVATHRSLRAPRDVHHLPTSQPALDRLWRPVDGTWLGGRRRRHGDHHCRLALGKGRVQHRKASISFSRGRPFVGRFVCPTSIPQFRSWRDLIGGSGACDDAASQAMTANVPQVEGGGGEAYRGGGSQVAVSIKRCPG